MTITDYRARLDTGPLTPNQRGRIMGEFHRLGFHQTRDRAERLRLTAQLAGLSGVASVKDLTRGEAGRVVRALTDCGTAQDLYALTHPDPPGMARVLAGILALLNR